MSLQQILIYIISFIVGLFISEILSDFLVIKLNKNSKVLFKFRFNFEALNPFIKHDKALLMYFIEVILIGVFTYYLQMVFTLIVQAHFSYYLPICSLVITCLYILGIKKLSIPMNSKRWIIFLVLLILTAGLFFIIYWIRNPTMFQDMSN